MAADYIAQRYEHEFGKAPKAAHVSEVFGAKLAEVSPAVRPNCRPPALPAA